jgi:DNA-binding NarL/FixJ family response regulator
VTTSAMRGAVAACRGQVKTAARWFRQSIAGGADIGMAAWTYPACWGWPGTSAADGAALQAASIQLEAMGALLLAADAAAHAAAAYTRHDRRGSGQAATARAHRLAQACEGTRTPALAALTAPLPLTTRKREIVTLAAGGLSNRQIAERLTVSVCTVEGHLYRACTKLGAGDRTELAALIHGY